MRRHLIACGLLFALYPEPVGAHERDPEHDCVAPVRADKNDAIAWNHFIDLVDTYRACVNRFVEAHYAASERHRLVANSATRDWNAFVRSELNVPEDFPHRSASQQSSASIKASDGSP